jgi:hypothetical protein
MTTTFVGDMSIEAVIPGPLALVLAAQAELDAKLAAMIAFSLKLGLPALSITAQLDIAASITASLQAALEIGIVPPQIDAQLEIVLAVIAQLNVQLEIFITLLGLMAAAGLYVYAVDSTASGVGGELTTTLAGGLPGGSGPGAHVNALVLVTELGATWTAMGEVFKTS